MKVYGFDETDILRGEMRAANVDAEDLNYRGQLEHSLGWDHLYRRFDDARKGLAAFMKAEGMDPEEIAAVRSLRATDIPTD